MKGKEKARGQPARLALRLARRVGRLLPRGAHGML